MVPDNVNAELLQGVDRVGGILSTSEDLLAVGAQLLVGPSLHADEYPTQARPVQMFEQVQIDNGVQPDIDHEVDADPPEYRVGKVSGALLRTGVFGDKQVVGDG